METKAQTWAVETAEDVASNRSRAAACPRVPGVNLSALASVLFAAGIGSFVLLVPKEETVPAAPAPSESPSAAPLPAAAPEVLAPFSPETAPAFPQYEDGLVPMSISDLVASG